MDYGENGKFIPIDENVNPNAPKKYDEKNSYNTSVELQELLRYRQVLSTVKQTTTSISNKKKCNCLHTTNTIILIVLTIVFIVTGILLFEYSLFNLATTFRLKMTPGLPPYELWAHPTPIVYTRVHIFAVTNSKEFLNGSDTRMKLMEIGPIVFQEHLKHSDVEFHPENSTMSYTVHRYLEFLPNENEPGIMNKTIIVPNTVLLGMLTRIANAPLFTVKLPFNILSKNDPVFVNTTVYNYLWNITTPALNTVNKFASFLVPQDNGGALHTVYKEFTDRVNVNIGPKYSFEDFFKINTYNYRPTVPGYKPELGDCFASLMNSSEGAIYPNFLTKDSTVVYWRKSVCRAIPLYFQEEVEIDSITGYKFVTRVDWYDRLEDISNDCYRGMGEEDLPDGISDASKCYSDLPVAVSAPHFYGRSGYWEDQLEGFEPSLEKHGSYAIIEPITGIPLDQKARSQSNLIMPKLEGFSVNVKKFSKLIVPLIWIEYHLPKLTPEITALLYFTAVVLPILTYIVPVILLFLSVLCLYFATVRLNSNFKGSKIWSSERNYKIKQNDL